VSNYGTGVFQSMPGGIAGATYLQSYNMGTFTDAKLVYNTLDRVK